MTSGKGFPRLLTKIDELTRPDHWYLDENDACYFLGEYTARRGHAYSATNNLILNFKKSMDRRTRPEWRYKDQAIRDAATAFRTALKPEVLERLTFVPIPPSKAREDPLYDNRLTKMLCAVRENPPLNVRELVVQTVSTEPVHVRDERPTPADIAALYRIDERLAEPRPEIIAIVDDILTTGAHFRAASSILTARFPDAHLFGLFIARRVPDSADFADITCIEP